MKNAGRATGLNDYAKAVARQASSSRSGRRPVYGDGMYVGAADLTPEGRVLFWMPIRDHEHEPDCTKKPCSCLNPWVLVVIAEPYDGEAGQLVKPSRTHRVQEAA